jgi:hypothetical protein
VGELNDLVLHPSWEAEIIGTDECDLHADSEDVMLESEGQFG